MSLFLTLFYSLLHSVLIFLFLLAPSILCFSPSVSSSQIFSPLSLVLSLPIHSSPLSSFTFVFLLYKATPPICPPLPSLLSSIPSSSFNQLYPSILSSLSFPLQPFPSSSLPIPNRSNTLPATASIAVVTNYPPYFFLSSQVKTTINPLPLFSPPHHINFQSSKPSPSHFLLFTFLLLHLHLKTEINSKSPTYSILIHKHIPPLQ